MSNPEVCVLKTDGINCDMEMGHAFEVAGASPEIVHVNQLRNGEKRLSDYSILAIPGGFSYGDDVASGKVLANELTSFMADEIQAFADANRPTIGVCNGDQVLMRTGLLPFMMLGSQQATLAENDSGRFECRWVNLSVGSSVCRFAQAEDFEDELLPMQVAHGEGKFVIDDEGMSQLTDNQQIVFRYESLDGQSPVSYPDNPNGSVDDIAGICDPKGLILGMMPHPERSVEAFHPHRSRTEAARGAANILFKNIVKYAREL